MHVYVQALRMHMSAMTPSLPTPGVPAGSGITAAPWPFGGAGAPRTTPAPWAAPLALETEGFDLIALLKRCFIFSWRCYCGMRFLP